ncbi:MAG: antibiotic biosynthesis monooxygenase [Blastococcus sp.]|nr:antibiotic biosynthesis monooxygenase [Blastococcus sp.]
MFTRTTKALVVRLTAKPETHDEVAAFLAGAVELANGEAGTTVWLALRTDESTFWIVDAFPGSAERQAHLDGPIAAALMQNADRLLATAPEILPADVLAAKIP